MDTEELKILCNNAKLKHVLMGAKLWNSLTSKFQIDIQGSQSKFKMEQECDGPLLFDFMRRRLNPSTTVGASKFKDEIDTKTLADFNCSVTDYNTWFEDIREKLLRKKRTDITSICARYSVHISLAPIKNLPTQLIQSTDTGYGTK